MRIFMGFAAAVAALLSTPAWAGPTDLPANIAPPPAAVALPPPVALRAPPPPPLVTSARPSLNGDFVYVYSFLDIRQEQLGAACLELVDRNLVEALKANGAGAKVLNFKESPTGSTFANFTGPGHSSTAIPVREVVADNAEDERATGARYRLVIVPSEFTSSGAWQFWTIRWVLIDVAANRVVWSTTTQGKRLVWMNYNEGGEPRAKGIVDKFMVELRKSGMVAAPG